MTLQFRFLFFWASSLTQLICLSTRCIAGFNVESVEYKNIRFNVWYVLKKNLKFCYRSPLTAFFPLTGTSEAKTEYALFEARSGRAMRAHLQSSLFLHLISCCTFSQFSIQC
jgi:hypothetical protein